MLLFNLKIDKTIQVNNDWCGTSRNTWHWSRDCQRIGFATQWFLQWYESEKWYGEENLQIYVSE